MKRTIESFVEILKDELEHSDAYERKIKKSKQHSKILDIKLGRYDEADESKQYLDINCIIGVNKFNYFVDVVVINRESDEYLNSEKSYEDYFTDYKNSFKFDPSKKPLICSFPDAVMIYFYGNNMDVEIRAISTSILFDNPKYRELIQFYNYRYLALTSLNTLLELDKYDNNSTLFFRFADKSNRMLYSKMFNIDIPSNVDDIFLNSSDYSELLICKRELISRNKLLDMIDFLTPNQKEEYFTKKSYEIVNVYPHKLEHNIQGYTKREIFEIYSNCDGDDIEKSLNHNLYFTFRNMLFSNCDERTRELLWREINRVLYNITWIKNWKTDYIHLAYLTKDEFKNADRIRGFLVYLKEIYKRNEIAIGV